MNWEESICLSLYSITVQTSEVSEDPSCSSNSESGNDLVCWHSTAVAGFETPFVCESYLDSEDSAYGNVLIFIYSMLVSKICCNLKKQNKTKKLTICLAFTFSVRNFIKLSKNWGIIFAFCGEVGNSWTTFADGVELFWINLEYFIIILLE